MTDDVPHPTSNHRVMDQVLDVLIECLVAGLPLTPLRTEKTLDALRELKERRAVETSLNEPATLDLLRALHDHGTGGAPIERLKELCRAVGCTRHWQYDCAQKAAAESHDHTWVRTSGETHWHCMFDGCTATKPFTQNGTTDSGRP